MDAETLTVCGGCGGIHGRGWHAQRIELVRQWLYEGGSVLLYGTLSHEFLALVEQVISADGLLRVLPCGPRPGDGKHHLLGLVRLLSSVSPDELAELGTVDRAALAWAASPGGAQPEPRRGGGEHPLAFPVGGARGPLRTAVLGRATLHLLAILARVAPPLLIVDGIQRLDDATRDVLGFALPRLVGLPVRVVVASDGAEGDPTLGHRIGIPPALTVFT